MIAYGVLTRGAWSGFWLYEHDLGGSDWTMLLRMERETARYLHDHGVLCLADEPIAATLRPGIVVDAEGLEARLCLSRPETRVARRTMPQLALTDQRTPVPLCDLWSSRAP